MGSWLLNVQAREELLLFNSTHPTYSSFRAGDRVARAAPTGHGTSQARTLAQRFEIDVSVTRA